MFITTNHLELTSTVLLETISKLRPFKLFTAGKMFIVQKFFHRNRSLLVNHHKAPFVADSVNW